VKNFDTSTIKKGVMEKCAKLYMDHADWSQEKIKTSSKAAEPLYLWAEA